MFRIVLSIAIHSFIPCVLGACHAFDISFEPTAISIDATSRGAITENDLGTSIINNNFAFDTGRTPTVFNNVRSEFLRSYFIFDLPDIALIRTARLAQLHIDFTSESYQSDDTHEEFSLYDIQETNIPRIISGENSQDIFGDIGSGHLYGKILVSQEDEGSTLQIPLDNTFLEFLRVNGGQSIGIGGVVSSLDGPLEWIFHKSRATPLSSSRLVISIIPEPTTFCLLGFMLCFGAMSRCSELE